MLPAGGTYEVTVTNNGQGDLVISSVSSTVDSFSANYNGGTLSKGESVTFDIAYNGSVYNGSGIIYIYSDDLDPGEAAVDFTLPVYSKDSVTGDFMEDTFTISDCRGKVVWIGIYGSL